MAGTPNLDEMKAATETGKLADAFKVLILHEKVEENNFIGRIGEESSQLREVILKKARTIDEVALNFSRFHAVASTGHDCLMEIQQCDRRKLDLMAQLLLLSRRSLELKDQLVERIEEAESSDDED